MAMTKYVICVLLFILSFSLPACAENNTKSTLPDAEKQARECFLAGEAAQKTGDLLTAALEWEAVLRLKPTSDYTKGRLVDLKSHWPKSTADAYDAMLRSIAACDANDLDKATVELSTAIRLCPDSKCVSDQARIISEKYKAIRDAADKEAEGKSRHIVVEEKPKENVEDYPLRCRDIQWVTVGTRDTTKDVGLVATVYNASTKRVKVTIEVGIYKKGSPSLFQTMRWKTLLGHSAGYSTGWIETRTKISICFHLSHGCPKTQSPKSCSLTNS